MVLVVEQTSFSDCYVQWMLIQMGLLKSIEYSTFEVSALNEIIDENGLLKEENEHFWY